MKDVARAAGVSLSTVSNALSGNVHVSDATKKRVLDAMQRLNYQKNGIAADLKRASAVRTIALIVDDLAGPFFSRFIQGVQQVAMDNQYEVVACSALGGKDSIGLKFLLEKRTSGVIVFASGIPNETLMEASGKELPIVVVDQVLHHTGLSSITVDNLQGGYLATKHPIDQGQRDILNVAGSRDSVDDTARILGYEKALQEAGLHAYSDLRSAGDFTETGGYRAIRTLIEKRTLPSAVFFANDEMAIGGMRAFASQGIGVPDDISVVGFDDIVLASYVTPTLTTVRQPIQEMGALAMNLLLSTLLGESQVTDYQLSCELVVRQSTQAMPIVSRR